MKFTPSTPRGDRPDTMVQAFDAAMVERYLQEKSLPFEKIATSTFQTLLNIDELNGYKVVLRIIVSSYDTYSVKIVGTAMFPVEDRAKLVMLCNAWNIGKLYPKAYAFSDPALKDSELAIFLERSVNLKTGIHQGLLNDFTERTIQGAYEFWQWAAEEQGVTIGTK